MFNQDNILNLISLSYLTICLQGNVWILQGEVTCLSLLGVKGFRDAYSRVVFIQRFRVVLELVILSFIILLK